MTGSNGTPTQLDLVAIDIASSVTMFLSNRHRGDDSGYAWRTNSKVFEGLASFAATKSSN